MDSLQLLRLSEKGGDRFEWIGDVQELDKFFAALHYVGTWSKPNGEGNPHKFTNKDFTCTWYASKKSLLIQGKKSKDLIDKLRHVLKNPISLVDAKDENKHSASKDVGMSNDTESHSSAKKCNDSNCTDVCDGSKVKEEKEFNEADFLDGIVPGKTIKNLLEFRMKKWANEGARITVTTPFLDSAGLKFILSCLNNKRALDKIYTREVCGWNNKKIDRVIAESQLAGQWFVNNVAAIKKTPSFHAKFLAGEYEDKVELILTSCNFTSEHLFSEQLETVMRLESSVEKFHSDWLRPLETMAEEEGNTAKFLNMDDIMREVQNIE